MLKDLAARLGIFLLCLSTQLVYAQNNPQFNPRAHSIQISADIHSVTSKSILTLIIRDIDRNINIPYVFDFTIGHQYWVVPIPSGNYFVKAAQLQIAKYQPSCNSYKNIRLDNFCNIESHGRILKGKSMQVFIEGDLTPNTSRLKCHANTFSDGNL